MEKGSGSETSAEKGEKEFLVQFKVNSFCNSPNTEQTVHNSRFYSGLAVPSTGDRLGALQASAVRDVSGVAVSGRDRCGALHAGSECEIGR